MPFVLAAAIPWIIKGLVAAGTAIAGGVKKSNAEKDSITQQNMANASSANNMLANRKDMQGYVGLMNAFKIK